MLWLHCAMETPTSLLALCVGNPPVTGRLATQRANYVTLAFSFLLAWTKQPSCLWFQMPWFSFDIPVMLKFKEEMWMAMSTAIVLNSKKILENCVVCRWPGARLWYLYHQCSGQSSINRYHCWGNHVDKYKNTCKHTVIWIANTYSEVLSTWYQLGKNWKFSFCLLHFDYRYQRL